MNPLSFAGTTIPVATTPDSPEIDSSVVDSLLKKQQSPTRSQRRAKRSHSRVVASLATEQSFYYYLRYRYLR